MRFQVPGSRFQVSGHHPGSWVPYLAAALALLVSCSRPPAPPPAGDGVRASLSTNTIHIGELATLTVSVAHPAGTRAELPNLARDRQIVVRNVQSATNHLPGAEASAFQVTLTSFEIGSHILSSNAVRIVGTNGLVVARPFPFLALTVESTLTGSNTPPREMKSGLARWPMPTPYWVLAVLSAIALLALLIGLAVTYLRRRARAPAPPPVLPPAHEIALAALRQLREKGWIEARHIEPFYVDLSGIVRRYLESRFALRAPERTTEEFIREASTSRLLTQEHQAVVCGFLAQSDLVKFARHEPGAADMENALAAGERLVRETIPAAADAAAGPAGPAAPPAPEGRGP